MVPAAPRGVERPGGQPEAHGVVDAILADCLDGRAAAVPLASGTYSDDESLPIIWF
jgi:hypothetical protein